MNSTGGGEFLNKLYKVFFTPARRIITSGGGGGSGSGSAGGVDTSDGSIVSDSGSSESIGRNLDLYQISSRLNRSFFDGTTPFTSFYIVPLILAVGLVIALIWLWCACSYYTMKKLRFPSWCPSRKAKKGDPEDPSFRRKETPTPEILEERRQERLSVLQKECEHLEQQLTDEKNTTLTSRASDSDLEYLGASSDSPPLKRNSISLQDIPQSVIRIRREKQLRQLKEEIENLQSLSRQQSQQDLPGSSKSPSLLTDFKFEYHGKDSLSTSPVDVPVIQPLSQHINHLKAHRKLQQIRSEIEDLAIHLIHSDELRAKTASLQDLPRTALIAKRQENLLNISKEIENIKNYKLQERNVLGTVPPTKAQKDDKAEILAKLNKSPGKSFSKQASSNASPSKSPLLIRQESEMSETSTKTDDTPHYPHSSSFKRTRQQELNRVRVELKELSYKLNLNYSFENTDRDKMLQHDWSNKPRFSRENSYNK